MEEHVLRLPNSSGQVAYAHNGDPAGRTVVIFFPGMFSVGTARSVCHPLRDIGAHWISVTLPGMGNSSSRPRGDAYHVHLARVISGLLDHLHPDGIDRLFVSGGSFGTVPAQMIYGAPYDLFPYGRQLAGCLIMACFSPFKYHSDYAKSLIWPNYISMGPPSQLVPFHLVQRLLRRFFASQLSTLEGAEKFLRTALFDKMDADETAMFEQYLTKEGQTEAEFVRDMSETILRSNANWDGFMEISDVTHSDWGFVPRELDEEHARKPILIVGSEQDELGDGMNQWLVSNYKSAHFRRISGGHISALFYQDELWEQMVQLASEADHDTTGITYDSYLGNSNDTDLTTPSRLS